MRSKAGLALSRVSQAKQAPATSPLLRSFVHTEATAEATAELPTAEDFREHGENAMKNGLDWLVAGNLTRAGSLLDESLELFLRHGQPHPVSLRNVHNAIGITKHQQGDYHGARKSLHLALSLCEEQGLYGQMSDTYTDLVGLLNDTAVNELAMGNVQEAEKLLKRALFSSKRAYSPNVLIVQATLSHLGELLMVQGDYDAGEESHREAVAMSPSDLFLANNRHAASSHSFVAPPHFRISALANLGRACLLNGKVEEATTIATQAHEACRQLQTELREGGQEGGQETQAEQHRTAYQLLDARCAALLALCHL
jgi:tetratricopeptide (TPR) repeat protein